MPVTPTYPGVYIEEIPSGVRTITGVATSIALFVGWAKKGPTDKAQRVLSFAEFERNFGGLDSRSLLGYAVYHFFNNGGQDAYILRLADDKDAGDDKATAKSATITLKEEVADSPDKEFLIVTAKNAGVWGDSYGVSITEVPVDPPNTTATRFNLSVVIQPSKDQQAVVESFPNLSMEENDRRFVEAIVNRQSSIVTVEAKGEELPPKKTEELSGGNDGDVLKPGDTKFKNQVASAATEAGVLDRIDLFNIMCVPGLTDPVKVAELQKFCRDRRAFLIVDTEKDAKVSKLQDDGPGGLTGSDSPNSAMYFPWIDAPDPAQDSTVRAFPPCGFVAGLFARNDTARGVWKAPAGTEASVNGAAGLTTVLTDKENGILNQKAVNCIRTFPVYGTVVWGARTLHGDDQRASEWKYIPVRRTALFIEESLFRGLKWVVFEPNDEPLWSQIRSNVGAFMQGLFRQGAFQGTVPKEAYFVKCDKDTTTQNDINLGIVNIVVGFAPLKPAEFVIVKLQQMAGQTLV